MGKVYLAIEKNIAVHKRESTFWMSKNISSVHVTSMLEGIEKAANNEFLYIGINADNIDYMPTLRLLREVSIAPILVSATSYSKEQHREVTGLGADYFGELSDNPEENYAGVMTAINMLDERGRMNKPVIDYIYNRNILLSKTHRQVFVHDKYVDLTKTEYDILLYLMSHKGHSLTFEQIYSNAWNNNYDEFTIQVVKNAVSRLRKKIDITDRDTSFIKNVWSSGYIFSV